MPESKVARAFRRDTTLALGAPVLSDVRSRCTCPGATVWLTGQQRSDRMAAAFALAERLLAEQHRVEVLDQFDGPGTNVERTGVMAEVLARNGIVAIVPCATDNMAAARKRHEASGTRYLEVPLSGQEGPADTAAEVHRLLVEHE
ncbi:hypothetical protein [Streptomyces sp. TS71-3]|uniref:hypothetical protein n=1 Tax=Streptomyces sp. TS71-3 TaxID=2733862 RepID=UPI001B13996B|nr:hypothetical protein [Streptomyces sp. TS71-3]GHJ41314.1 hypothetical protein Sm713_69230 [Streptomyces sp. TS71-3]